MPKTRIRRRRQKALEALRMNRPAWLVYLLKYLDSIAVVAAFNDVRR
jgi:hypothetical protein